MENEVSQPEKSIGESKPIEIEEEGTNKNKTTAIILVILIILAALVLIAIITTSLFLKKEITKPVVTKPEVEKITNLTSNATINQTEEEIIIYKEYITYILNELGAYKLHNPPFSSQTPKIRFDVDGEIFSSEIVNHKIYTEKANLWAGDIKITSTKEEVVSSLDSDNMGGFYKISIENNESRLDIIANQEILFLKGYLEIYGELTGEEVSVTGAILWIFREDW